MSFRPEQVTAITRALLDDSLRLNPDCACCVDGDHRGCTGEAVHPRTEDIVACRCALTFEHSDEVELEEREDAASGATGFGPLSVDDEGEAAATICAGCGTVDPAGHAHVIIGGDAADVLGITALGRLPICAPCERKASNIWAHPQVALSDALALIQTLHGLMDTDRLTVEESCNFDAQVEEMRRRVEAICGTEDVRS